MIVAKLLIQSVNPSVLFLLSTIETNRQTRIVFRVNSLKDRVLGECLRVFIREVVVFVIGALVGIHRWGVFPTEKFLMTAACALYSCPIIKIKLHC